MIFTPGISMSVVARFQEFANPIPTSTLVLMGFLSQSSGAGNSWETPANSRSLWTGALVRRTRLSDLSKATSRQLVPVESMRNSTHIDKDSLSAQRFSEGVGNRHVYFPADSYKACPIEIPNTEIERSSIDRRARFFLLCVQNRGSSDRKEPRPPWERLLRDRPPGGWGARDQGVCRC